MGKPRPEGLSIISRIYKLLRLSHCCKSGPLGLSNSGAHVLSSTVLAVFGGTHSLRRFRSVHAYTSCEYALNERAVPPPMHITSARMTMRNTPASLGLRRSCSAANALFSSDSRAASGCDFLWLNCYRCHGRRRVENHRPKCFHHPGIHSHEVGLAHRAFWIEASHVLHVDST